MTDLDKHWSMYFDTGNDFIYLSPSSLSKILDFTDDIVDKSALDIGCGTGQITRDLVHRGYSATGIDVSSSAVKIATQSTVFGDTKIKFLQLNIEQDELPISQDGYSLVVCKLVIAFIKDKADLYKKVSEVLHNYGVFVIITPHIEDVMPEKANIAVYPNLFKKELEEFFTVKSVYQDVTGWTYICKKSD